jgi:hypothetical protein
MTPRVARAFGLEIALVAEIREKGSQNLLDAFENCKIRVEFCNGYIYSVVAFPPGYNTKLAWDICSEIEAFGFPLEIFGCNSVWLSRTPVFLCDDSDEEISTVCSSKILNQELINLLSANPQLEEGERLLLVTLQETKRLEASQIWPFQAIMARLGFSSNELTDSDNSTH